MRAAIHVRGSRGDIDVWPYVGRAEQLGEDSLLTVEVADGRELVGLLVALSERGLTVVTVESYDDRDASPGSNDPSRP